VSEFEFRESPSPETGRAEREGLPPGYRMRADAHYVDSLSVSSPAASGSARADRARDAGRSAVAEDAAPQHHDGRDRRLLDQLTEDVAAIESAAALLAADGSALGKRVGLDLIKAQSARASWLLRANALQHGADPGNSGRRRPVGTLLAEIRDRVAVECRLNGVGIEVQTSDEAAGVVMPDAGVLVGVTGAVMAQLGLAAGLDNVIIRLHGSVRHGESVVIDVSQEAVPVSPATTERFFDGTWVTRPGGPLAATGASSAKLAAERQGGSASVMADRRGCTIRLTLPLERNV